jgi:hypothetical protein
MGYNATVVVLLDRLDEIEKDPEFGKKLSAAIRARASYRGWEDKYPDRANPYVPGQTYVADVAHADALQIVAVGGNTGRVIAHCYYTDTNDQIIRRLNRERLHRERAARKAAEDA